MTYWIVDSRHSIYSIYIPLCGILYISNGNVSHSVTPNVMVNTCEVLVTGEHNGDKVVELQVSQP